MESTGTVSTLQATDSLPERELRPPVAAAAGLWLAVAVVLALAEKVSG